MTNIGTDLMRNVIHRTRLKKVATPMATAMPYQKYLAYELLITLSSSSSRMASRKSAACVWLEKSIPFGSNGVLELVPPFISILVRFFRTIEVLESSGIC